MRCAAALLALGAAGCGRLSDDDAVDLVGRYNRAVIEAFRTSDGRRVEAVAGKAEAKKLTALIGVKYDQGITLDARLQEFEPRGVERRGDEIFVRTRERWYYLDRRIGSGAQVGPDSHDTYDMRYRLAREGERWVVAGIEFASAPSVERPEVMSGPAPALHGIQTVPPDPVGGPAGTGRNTERR